MRDLKPYASNSAGGWLRDLLILAVVLGIPFFQYLGAHPLMDPDEGRYAEIPREMLERGDLITPTLNYVKYFEKPPLLYWINAASLKIFGQNEFAARFPSALCGLLTVLVAYIIARQLYGRRCGLISALILGTSAGFVLQSRIILTDMLLTFCLTAALGAFVVAIQREGRRSRALPWYLFYLFCALATLAKGLIGMVFPAGIIFFYLLFSRRWRLLTEMRLPSGLLLFLAVAAPWFVAVSLRNPEFARFFFIHEHFERFTSTVHGRYQPFWFFVPVLLGTMLPWSFFIPGALVLGWRERHHEEGRHGLFLLIWILLIFLFFSKSGSKLIPYILPIFPPLAILIGHRIDLVLNGRGRSLKVAAILLGIMLVVLGGVALGYARLPQIVAFLTGLVPGWSGALGQFVRSAPALSLVAVVTLGSLFLLQGIGTLASVGRNSFRMLVVLCLGSFLLEIAVPKLIMADIARNESPRDLALKAQALAVPDTRIITFGPMQAVSWYTGKRVLVAGKIDELEFGSRQGDQAVWFPDRQGVLTMWSAEKPVLMLLMKGEFDSIRPLLQPEPVIIGVTGRRFLISNR
jgi:4-amino-4-deoxy-L-arabinose transferase-like glycosyltransferase